MESATKFQKPSPYNGETRTDAVTPFLHRFPYCIVWTPIPLLTYYQPHPKDIPSREIWDKALFEANEVYKGRVAPD
ncbi:unnamed protein product [Trichobilharzia regenti]|nr:unnamed protein product [Trichobilharzia regenti]